jgi:hypothetical protein
MSAVQHEKVTAAELRARLDALSRDKLNMSADEFTTRLKDADLDMSSMTVCRLAELARLVAEASRAERP